MLLRLEKYTRALFILSLSVTLALYFLKDRLPPPAFYDIDSLADPRQWPTQQKSFVTRVHDEQYRIKPLYDYELDGVIVSYHNADDFTDIWHHERWRDFINLRDLCVIWGNNVASGVYHEMDFHNDSWTCWVSGSRSAVRGRFEMTQISNNHVLIDDERVKTALMNSGPGDHIRLRGILAEYSNPASGFHRSTSIVRNDTGNGACETIYVTDFEIVKKANPLLRLFYGIAKWITIITLAGVVILFFITPYRGRYA